MRAIEVMFVESFERESLVSKVVSEDRRSDDGSLNQSLSLSKQDAMQQSAGGGLPAASRGLADINRGGCCCAAIELLKAAGDH